MRLGFLRGINLYVSPFLGLGLGYGVTVRAAIFKKASMRSFSSVSSNFKNGTNVRSTIAYLCLVDSDNVSRYVLITSNSCIIFFKSVSS